MRLRSALVAFVAAGSLVASACGGDDGDGGSTTAAPATTAGSATTAAAAGAPNIIIKGFAFTVTPAKAGTITIRNDGSAAHTVTADDGSFSVQVGGGETATIQVASAGSYAFHCNFHSSMQATLEVS